MAEDSQITADIDSKIDTNNSRGVTAQDIREVEHLMNETKANDSQVAAVDVKADANAAELVAQDLRIDNLVITGGGFDPAMENDFTAEQTFSSGVDIGGVVTQLGSIPWTTIQWSDGVETADILDNTQYQWPLAELPAINITDWVEIRIEVGGAATNAGTFTIGLADGSSFGLDEFGKSVVVCDDVYPVVGKHKIDGAVSQITIPAAITHSWAYTYNALSQPFSVLNPIRPELKIKRVTTILDVGYVRMAYRILPGALVTENGHLAP